MSVSVSVARASVVKITTSIVTDVAGTVIVCGVNRD